MPPIISTLLRVRNATIEEESMRCHEHCEMVREEVWQEVKEKCEGMKETPMKYDGSEVCTHYQDNCSCGLSREKVKKHNQRVTIKNATLSTLISYAEEQLKEITNERQVEEAMAELEEIEGEPVTQLDYSIPYQTALDKATGLLKSPYKIWKKTP